VHPMFSDAERAKAFYYYVMIVISNAKDAACESIREGGANAFYDWLIRINQQPNMACNGAYQEHSAEVEALAVRVVGQGLATNNQYCPGPFEGFVEGSDGTTRVPPGMECVQAMVSAAIDAGVSFTLEAFAKCDLTGSATYCCMDMSTPSVSASRYAGTQLSRQGETGVMGQTTTGTAQFRSE